MMVVFVAWMVAIGSLLVVEGARDLHWTIVEERLARERAELRTAAISALEAYRVTLEEHGSQEGAGVWWRGAEIRADWMQTVGDSILAVCFHASEDGPLRPITLTPGPMDEESRLNLLTLDLDGRWSLPGVSTDHVSELQEFIERPDTPPLRGLDDLTLVPGWSTVDLRALGEVATVVGDGRVNVNTASASVWRCLRMSEGAIDALERVRAGLDEMSGTPDDVVMRGVSELLPRLRESNAPSEVLGEWSRLLEARRLTADGTHFRFRVRALRLRGGAGYEVEAIVRAAKGVPIVAWSERVVG